MTEAELLTDLSSRSEIHSVGTPAEANPREGTINDIIWLVVNVLETSTDNMRAWRRNYYYYVYKRGVYGQEVAWYMQKEPDKVLDPEQKFIDIILDYIYDPAREWAEFAEVLEVDMERKRAKVRMYKQSNGIQGSQKDYFMWKTNGVVERREIV